MQRDAPIRVGAAEHPDQGPAPRGMAAAPGGDRPGYGRDHGMFGDAPYRYASHRSEPNPTDAAA